MRPNGGPASMPADAGATAPGPTADEDYALRRERTRQHFLLAAVLFLGGGLGAIAPDALHEPHYPATIFLLPLLATVSGAIVWALSARLRRRYLHVVAVVAALEIALTVGVADPTFAIYFTFVAIFAAYVFASRRAIAAHVGFVSLICFAPILYAPDSARESMIMALIVVPTLILAGGSVAYLRERLAASEDRYRRLSERDPLTGVGNYRMLRMRVPQELRRHRRHEGSLTLMVFDLDDFKRINDSYGHQRGDVVLQEVAAALVGGVREHDIVVRQGGDEFAVVAPETGGEAGERLARRLREAVGAIAPDGMPIGVSIGSAMFPDDADTMEGLLAAADARLREAKLATQARPARARAEMRGHAASGDLV